MAMFNPTTDGGYDDAMETLGLVGDNSESDPTSNYWAHLDGDALAAEIINKAKEFRSFIEQNGLSRGWRLKQHYYYGEFRPDSTIPHIALMEQFGANGEYSFVAINHLRSLLKTVIASITQNPPAYSPIAVNSDADALESAALYQGVLDYYRRDLNIDAKITRAVEIATVIDQSFVLVEWDTFAGGDAPAGTGIWKGAPSVKVLNIWDMTFDITKPSWNDLDWVIVRDFVSRQKCLSQFPEHADAINGCQSRTEIENSGDGEGDSGSRYQYTGFPDFSEDIAVFKMYHRATSFMPNGRFVMALENGTLLWESPSLMYPKLPVERFVCDDQIDILLGYSPINSLLAPQEAINGLVSAISTNAANYSNQFVAVEQGTEVNASTLSDGQRIITYPHGSKPPQGINLTSIPDSLFEHLRDLQNYMQTIPGISAPSRGQAPGANATGSGMLLLSGATAQNQGSMQVNYNQFSAAVMTSLLHVLRVFARTEKTINIMGKTVSSKAIVLAEGLKDFDEVIVTQQNPMLATPQGKLAFAQQLLQWGNATPAQALQVATSGTLGPAVDPGREAQYELDSESEWLLAGEQVLANALDDHAAHIAAHKRLFSTTYLRRPALAEKLGITNAPQLMLNIMAHIDQHMQFAAGNNSASVASTAGMTPGQPETAPSEALGHAQPMPQPSPALGSDNPAQASSVTAHTSLPVNPVQPNQPQA